MAFNMARAGARLGPSVIAALFFFRSFICQNHEEKIRSKTLEAIILLDDGLGFLIFLGNQLG